MRIPLLFIILGLFFVSLAPAQTIKTSDARKLEDVETSIIQTQKQIDEVTSALNAVLVKYTEDRPEVKKIRDRVERLNEHLTTLNVERVRLMAQKLTMPLPTNQIELLKILILQNERILDLLNTRLTKNR